MDDLFSLFNHSYDGIWINDYEGTVLYVNEKACEIYQLPSNELVGKNAKEFIDQGLNLEIEKPLIHEAFAAKKPITRLVETYTNRKILVTATPIYDDKGVPWRAIVNNRDLTALSLDSTIADLSLTEYTLEHNIQNFLAQKNNNFLCVKDCYESQKLKSILDNLARISQTDVTILFEGETGVGKEFFAKYTHDTSLRHTKPFIVINCGAIPESLIEAELFGYEKGSFTGAIKQKAGYFEQAQGGTILLDEIGELPILMQVKLLRVLQDKKIQRIGSEKTIDLDIRIIAATNRNLKEMATQKNFREDLYYRLSIVSFLIPPLRERQTTIPPLIKFFAQTISEKYGMHATIGKSIVKILCEYHWPGNIRELENVLTQMILMSPQRRISLEQLPSYILDSVHQNKEKNWNLEVYLDSYEEKFISEALESFPSIRKAATALGITHPTLLRKMKKYNL